MPNESSRPSTSSVLSFPLLAFPALRCPCCPLTTSVRHAGVEASQRLRGIVYCLLKSFKLGTSHHLWVYPQTHISAKPQTTSKQNPNHPTSSQTPNHFTLPHVRPTFSPHNPRHLPISAVLQSTDHKPATNPPQPIGPSSIPSLPELTPRALNSRKLSQMLCVFFALF